MIDKHELRFDNWVYGSIRPNEPVQIKSIDTTICKAGEYLEDYKSINPIPLTEDILLKCGFVFITDWSIKRNEGFLYLLDLGYLMLGTGVMGGYVTLFNNEGLSCGIYVKYLHQLQNLYYSLTGEELKIDTL